MREQPEGMKPLTAAPSESTRVTVHMPDRDTAVRCLGQADSTLRLLEGEFPAVRHTRTVGTLPWQHILVFTKQPD